MPDPPPSAEFLRSLPMLLLRAREAVMARVRPKMRTFGLTEQQGRVLRTLIDSPPIDTARLARTVCLLRPSLARILQDMEAKGWVGRVAARPGGRRTLNVITEEGRALICEAAVESLAVQAEIERLYGPEALAELKRSLARLEALLNRSR